MPLFEVRDYQEPAAPSGELPEQYRTTIHGSNMGVAKTVLDSVGLWRLPVSNGGSGPGLGFQNYVLLFKAM